MGTAAFDRVAFGDIPPGREIFCLPVHFAFLAASGIAMNLASPDWQPDAAEPNAAAILKSGIHTKAEDLTATCQCKLNCRRMTKQSSDPRARAFSKFSMAR